MFLFGERHLKDKETLGVVLEISESVVSVGVVLSREVEQLPEIVWSFQELVTSSADANSNESRVLVALLNAFAELGTAGLTALRKREITKLPTLIQVAITAPLSYTVVRTVSVTNKDAFKVTQKLIDELEAKAGVEARKICESNLLTKDLDLEMLSNSTVSLSVNGYPTHFPFKSTATEVKLSQMITLSSKTIVTELNKLRDKILPNAEIDVDSFMSIYYRAVLEKAPNTSEACFINATANGVELMVVRDWLPASSIFGKASMPSNIVTQSPTKANDNKILQDLIALFKSSGEGLSLPKKIYLHSSYLPENSLASLLESASKTATDVAHQVHSTTKEFFSLSSNRPSSLACSAFVFRKKLYEDRYLDESLNVLKYS